MQANQSLHRILKSLEHIKEQIAAEQLLFLEYIIEIAELEVKSRLTPENPSPRYLS